MFNISFQALCKFLASCKMQFIIEQAKNDPNILKFVAVKGYPWAAPFHINKEYLEIVSTERINELGKRGETLLYYNTEHNAVIGVCVGWYKLLLPLREGASNANSDPP